MRKNKVLISYSHLKKNIWNRYKVSKLVLLLMTETTLTFFIGDNWTNINESHMVKVLQYVKTPMSIAILATGETVG